MIPHGIPQSVLALLLKTCRKYSNIEQVMLYGSRARGDHRHNSDIDIAISAPDMDDVTFSKLWNEIDDLPIIYSIDCLHLQSLHNQALLEAIKKEGILLSL
jgi:uncharacterized protein